MAKSRRVNGFSLGPDGVFDDPKKEAFAKSFAKKGLLKDACAEADISLPTGQKWRGHEEVERRIRTLRAGAETYVGYSKAWIINQLALNAQNAQTSGKYRESNDALQAMFRLQSTDRDLTHGSDVGVASTFGDMTPEQLAEQRAKMFPSPMLPPDTRVMVEDEDGVFSEEPALTSDQIVGNPDAHYVGGKWTLTEKYEELSKPFEGPIDDDEAAEE